MARSKAATYDDQRESILAKAADLFAQRGYHGTSMNDVAEASGLSKATLYHYYRDKDQILVNIAEGHVTRLHDLVVEIEADASLPPTERLEVLIVRFLQAYARAQSSHRVLTEDVKFLPEADRERIVSRERAVVRAFADAVAVLRPDLRAEGLDTAVSMLLFGMLNWMFTWLRPNGRLDHTTIAPMVCELFFHGLQGITVPKGAKAPRKARPPRA